MTASTNTEHLVEIIWLTPEPQLAGRMLTLVSVSEEHGFDVSHGDAEDAGHTVIDIWYWWCICIDIVLLLMFHTVMQKMLATMILTLY